MRAIGVVAAGLTGCVPLAGPLDVTGNYEATYLDNLRVYLGDDLVADVVAGEDAEITWDGQVFHTSQVCADDGVECPGETYWRTVGVDQPWGTSQGLVNFVNLDPERGTLGQRLGGTVGDDGAFEMLAGLDLAAGGACASVGVGKVFGTFTGAGVDAGVVSYEWGGGCEIGGVGIGVGLRLETDFTAVRTGPLDLGAIDAEPAVTTSGSPTAP